MGLSTIVIAGGLSVALGAQQAIFELGPGISPPVLVKRVKPQVTPEATAAGLVGWVSVETVVRIDGVVSDVRVVRSCVGRIGEKREPNGDPFRCRDSGENARKPTDSDPSLGLDTQAGNAVKQWVFRPALKDGKPVAVRMTIVVDFRPDVPR